MTNTEIDTIIASAPVLDSIKVIPGVDGNRFGLKYHGQMIPNISFGTEIEAVLFGSGILRRNRAR